MPKLFQQSALVLLEIAGEVWLRDLREVLPERLKVWLTDRGWTVISLSDEVLPLQQLRPAAVQIPAYGVLLRTIRLPLASKIKLKGLMRFEALQQVPLPLTQVRVDHRIVGRDLTLSSMLVEMAIIRNETVVSVLEKAEMLGHRVDAIAIESEHGLWISRPLAGQSWQEALFNKRIFHLTRKFVTPLILALFCILAVQHWTARLVASRQAELTAAEHDAAAIAPLRRHFLALNTQLSYLAHLRTQPSAARITEEIARLLPDGAWLQELDIEESTVTIRGTATRATDLLKIFSSSQLFSDVRFEAPLTPAYNGSGQQFDIIMALN